jgi:hypothetical protein
MDPSVKDRILILTRMGRTAQESTDWFRTALGLYYLAGLMTPETIDFKKKDREYNRFIYHVLGRGHSITSVLQFMSGHKVVPVLESERFMQAFRAHCTEVPPDTIAFLLSLNLGVARKISKIDIAGPLLDWIERQKPAGDGSELTPASVL